MTAIEGFVQTEDNPVRRRDLIFSKFKEVSQLK